MHVRKRWSTTIVLSMLLILFLACLIPFQSVSAGEIGKITGDNLNVRTAPSTDGDVLGKLNTNDQIEILGKNGDWYKFKFQNQTAYVHSSFVKAVTTPSTKPVQQTGDKIAVIVNGEELLMPISPPLNDGRVLVPFRKIGEALGVNVQWIASKKQVKAIDQEKEILFTINSNDVFVNGKKTTTDSVPYITSSHTVLPLRFFAENFNAVVGWNSQTKTVYINREVKIEEPVQQPGETDGRENEEPVDPIEQEPGNEPSTQNPEPAPPSVEIKYATTDGLRIYPDPFTGGEAIAELKKGEPLEVIGMEGSDWYKVNYNGETGYVFYTLLSSSVSGSLTGTVIAPELNIRKTAEYSAQLLGQVSKGETYEVYDLIDQWAKIKVGSQWGYVHAYYLDLKKDGISYVELVKPTLTKSNNRDRLTWSKQGPAKTTHRIISGGVEINTTAKNVERYQASHPGIKEIKYVPHLTGTKIQILLQPSYHYVVRHTIDTVRVTLLSGGLAGKRIAIDAGHGAHDPGAIGPTGLREKDVNLVVTQKLAKRLTMAGAEVIYTRPNDTFLPLADRVKVAHQNDADVFISIHADAFKSTTQGTTVFYHSGVNPSWEQSKQLSDITIKKLVSKLGTVNRGSRDKNLHVIRETEIPAILVELAFLSNPNEEALLKQDGFQQKAADAMFDSLVEFYK